MTEAELRTMIDEGKSLDEIASEMAAGEYDVCSRETLLSYAISEIENDRLFLARHILDAVDSGEYADFYFYDVTMGTLDTPLAIEGIRLGAYLFWFNLLFTVLVLRYYGILTLR